jgi:4-amino-4-deoxy-L-arabinose transferase-like glycosyltransferase
MNITKSIRAARAQTASTSPYETDSQHNSPYRPIFPARIANFGPLTLLFLFLFCFRLGNVPLFDLDEGLYVTCARQMAISGDLVTPRLNTRLADRPGETTVPFFEKPILVYWAAAGTIRLFGQVEWAARLPAALAALFTGWLVFLVGSRWFGTRAGILAAVVYGAAPLTILDARELTPDGLLVLWFTGILVTFQALKTGDHNVSSLRARIVLRCLFWIFCALAVLTKGIIGLLLPMSIIFLTLLLDHVAFRVRVRGVKRPWLRFAVRLRAATFWRKELSNLRPLSGVLLFLLLTAPWFILIWRAGGRDELGHTFVQEYIIRQHVGRFKGQDAVHNLPLPSYLVFFVIGFFPWAGLVPAAFRFRLRGLGAAKPPSPRVRMEIEREAVDRDRHRFLLIWFWTVLLFFSLAAAKLPTYIAPAYPAAALLIGRWLDRVLTAGVPTSALRSLRRGAASATVIGLLLLAAALIGPRYAPANAPIPEDIKHVALHLTALLAGGSALAWACLRRTDSSVRNATAGIAIQVAQIVILVAVGCTEGYAVAARDVLLPYQRAAMAARDDAAHGVPVVYYNIIPRRPSMLYYAHYSPYEHKEPGILPYLRLALPADTKQADIVTSRATYDRLLQPELTASPAIRAGIGAEYGDGRSGWLLVRLIFTKPMLH